MTTSKAKASSTNGSAHCIHNEGCEEYKTLEEALKEFGLNLEEYKILKSSDSHRSKEQSVKDFIARFANRGAGIQPSSYDFERTLGTNDLVGVEYMSRGVRAAAAVGRILLSNESGIDDGYATGFMISPRLLLTNRHVLTSEAVAKASMVEFGYEKDERGFPKGQTQVFRLDPSEAFFSGGKDLDFAICAVETSEERGAPNASLSQWGFLRLDKQTGKVAELDYVSIIQHPGGDYKQVALRENKVISKNSAKALLYQSDTAKGSSGSPVFNDSWQVVAVHSKGVRKQGASTIPEDGQYEANLGVRISAIVKFLEANPQAKKNKLVRAFLADLQLGGPPVVTPRELADDEDDQEASNKKKKKKKAKAAAGVSRRESLKEQEKQALYGREGYDPGFLGVKVPLPDSSVAQQTFGEPVTYQKDDEGPRLSVLDYMHYSLEMCSSRKLAYWTAVNVDGTTAREPDKERKFRLEPRIKEKEQVGPTLYMELVNQNYFDQGHMCRRRDPCWGDDYETTQGGLETMYYSNCAPQYWEINRGEDTWQGIEDHILDNAIKDELKVSVFTGPIFEQTDNVHRGVQIPAAYWKVVVLVDGGKVRSSAYVVDQSEYVTKKALASIQIKKSKDEERTQDEDDEEVLPLGNPPNAAYNLQVTVASLQKRTGIDFGRLVLEGDVLGKSNAEAKPKAKKRRTARTADDDDESFKRLSPLAAQLDAIPLRSAADAQF